MNDSQQPARESHRIGIAVSLSITAILLAAIVGVLVFAGRDLWHYFRNPSELQALVIGWGAWAPLGIVGFQVLQIVIAPLPGNMVSFATGYVLGFWPGILWVMLGVIVGASVDFLLARVLGRRLLGYLMPPDRLARIDSMVVRRGMFYLFLLILIPNPIGDLAYYFAGLTPLPLPVFLLLVFVGRLPSNLVECWVGKWATGFGWLEWCILGAVLVVFAVAYFANQKRISRLLERWSHIRRPGRKPTTK